MPQVAYPNLESMYNTTAFTPFAMGMQQAQEAQRANQLNYDTDQHKLDQLKFEAPISNAEKILGFQQKLRDEDLASTLFDKQKNNAVKAEDVKGKELSARDISTYGQGLMQLGAAAKANGGTLPLSITANVDPQILQILQQPNGHEQVYNLGKAIHENSDKWLSQASKQDSAEDIAATKAAQRAAEEEGRNKRASEANALKARLATAHNALIKSNNKDPSTWQALATRYTIAANDPNATDEQRAVAAEAAQRAANMQAYYTSLAAQAKNVGTPDAGAITNLPTVKDKPVPNPAKPSTVKKDDKGRIILD